MDFKQGVLLINKQSGRTSHDEVAVIKRAFKKLGKDIKVGHSGTLDPKVTGLLVVGFGLGTKILEYMLHSEKRYVGEIVFHTPVTREQLHNAIKQFTGTIEQLPPRKSAVKREIREREVYQVEVISFDEKKKTAHLMCAVERGTYIRKLFHDMGEYMGVRAHMGDLHRTHVGPFKESSGLITTDEFAKVVSQTSSYNPITRYIATQRLRNMIRPISDAMVGFGSVTLHPSVENYLKTGSDVFVPGVASVSDGIGAGEVTVVYSHSGEAVAIGETQLDGQGILNSEKGVAVRTQKILI